MRREKLSILLISIILLFVVSLSFSAHAFEIQLTPYWNLVSVYTTDDIDLESECPTHNPKALIIEGSSLDVSTTVLESGQSYLVRVSKYCNVQFSGEAIEPNATNLTQGWNMIYAYLDTGLNYIEDQCGNSIAMNLARVNDRNILTFEQETLHAGTTYLLRVENNCTVNVGQNTGVANCTDCCQDNGYANAISDDKMPFGECLDPYYPQWGCPNCSITEVCCCENSMQTCSEKGGNICNEGEICYPSLEFVSSSDSDHMCCVDGVCANLTDEFSPNLFVSSITTDPYPVNTSHTTVDIIVNITNNGLEDSGTSVFYLVYQLSSFPDIKLVPNLQPGDTHTVTLQANVLDRAVRDGDGKAVGLGSNPISAIADAFGSVDESNEEDNLRAETITVTTGDSGDTTPPAIVASSPAGTNVDRNAIIWVQFSEEVLSGELNYTIRYSNGTEIDCTATYTASNKKITFTPTSPLEYDKTVIVTILNISDTSGNYMQSAHSFSFTVKSETPPQSCTGSSGKCLATCGSNSVEISNTDCSGSTPKCCACSSGFHFDGNTCVQGVVTYSCTGTTPSHSTMCSGDNSGLSVNTPKKAVDSCTTGTKCEWLCESGWHANSAGSDCVEDSIGAAVTITKPLGSEFVPGSSTEVEDNGPVLPLHK